MRTKTYVFTEKEVGMLKEAMLEYKHSVTKPALAEAIKAVTPDAELIHRLQQRGLLADALYKQFTNDFQKM